MVVAYNFFRMCLAIKKAGTLNLSLRVHIHVTFILLMIPSVTVGQLAEPAKNSDVLRFTDAIVNTTMRPVQWKGRDWVKVSAILAGTAVLTLADQPIRSFWINKRSDFLDGVNEVGYHYGKPYSAIISSGAFYLTGVLLKNDWSKETGLTLGAGFLTSSLLEATLKPLVGRARPVNGEGNYDITFFNKEPGFHSFPSGHASTAFTISFIMARRVKSVPLKILFYSLAASTVVCRLYSDAHWTSDIAFGSTIAWFCSDAAINRLGENRLKGTPRKFLWSVSPSSNGLSVKATF